MENKIAYQDTFGALLQGDFIERNGMSMFQIAAATGIPASEIEKLVKNERPLTMDDAERFAKVFGVSADYFINLYARCSK